MRTLPALLLVAALLVPSAAARPAPLPYPAPIAALAPKILDHVADLEANASGEPWWAGVKPWLDRAHADAEAGRFHATLYDAETYRELVLAHELEASANATSATAGDRRNFVIQTAASWRAASNATWTAFRAKVHEADGQLRSVGALETTLFAADLAIEAKSTDASFDAYVQRYAREPDPPFDYLLLFARLTQTPILDVQVAQDVLQEGFAQDGVPPAIVQDRWINNTRVALAPPASASPQMQRFEDLAGPVRANDEAIMAVALTLAEQGQGRLSGMETIFGDGASRGKAVVQDADHGFQRQLNNTTLEPSRSHGLAGLFMADAFDRAVYAQDVVDNGTASLGVVLNAWSGLDHAGYATNVLADVSPVKPAPAKATPGVGAPALVAAMLVAAVVARRRAA